MKCPACGYRYMEPDENSEKLKYISDSDEGFKDIMFSIDGEGYDVQLYILGTNNSVYLKACPKCNCVQMDKW